MTYISREQLSILTAQMFQNMKNITDNRGVTILIFIPPQTKFGVMVYRNLSVHRPCKHISSYIDWWISMKIYTKTIYHLRMCLKKIFLSTFFTENHGFCCPNLEIEIFQLILSQKGGGGGCVRGGILSEVCSQFQFFTHG